jgi:hypothetical protein
LPAVAKKVSSTRKPTSIKEVQRLEEAKRKLKHKKKAQAQLSKNSKPSKSESPKSARGKSAKPDRKSRSRSRAPAKSTNPLIFVGAGIIAIGAIALIAILNQSSPKQKSEAPTPVQSIRTTEEPIRRSPLKRYTSLSQAPKGVVLYKDRKTGEYIDPSGLPSGYRARYTKNTKDFARVSN